MRWRTVGFGTVGLVATALAAAIVFAPETLGIEGVLGTLDGVPSAALLSALGVAVLLVGAVTAWPTAGGSGTETTGYATAIESPPESVTVPADTLVGAQLDATVADAVEGEDAAMVAVLERLRGAATTVHARVTDCERSAAREAVRAGTWTDDRVAAALLSPTTPFPLGARLRMWLDPERERERRLRRTVTAVRDHAGGR